MIQVSVADRQLQVIDVPATFNISRQTNTLGWLPPAELYFEIIFTCPWRKDNIRFGASLLQHTDTYFKHIHLPQLAQSGGRTTNFLFDDSAGASTTCEPDACQGTLMRI